MAKVIEFYIRDLFPKKVKSVPRDQLGKLIEFPNDKAEAAQDFRLQQDFTKKFLATLKSAQVRDRVTNLVELTPEGRTHSN
jgi:hypothetical protein